MLKERQYIQQQEIVGMKIFCDKVNSWAGHLIALLSMKMPTGEVRSPGEITRLIAEGIVRTTQSKRRAVVESGGDWETSAATVLDAVKPGDLVLLQPDTIGLKQYRG